MKSHGSYLVELSDGSQLLVDSNDKTGVPVIKIEDTSFDGLRPFTESRPPSGFGRSGSERKVVRTKHKIS